MLKKGNKYIRLTTESLIFSDVLLFSSFRGKLKDFNMFYGVSEDDAKQFFPYKALKSVSSLDSPISRIQYKDFVSEFMSRNQLGEDRRRFLRALRRKKMRVADALADCGMDKVPPTGYNRFMKLKAGWIRDHKDLRFSQAASTTTPPLFCFLGH